MRGGTWMMDERWWMEAVDDGWSMGEDGWKTVDVESNNIGNEFICWNILRVAINKSWNEKKKHHPRYHVTE
jgi:hypothetical protein